MSQVLQYDMQMSQAQFNLFHHKACARQGILYLNNVEILKLKILYLYMNPDYYIEWVLNHYTR